MHRLTQTLKGLTLVALVSALPGFAQQPPAGGAAPAAQAPAAGAKEKKVKDQGEYDIFNEALKDVQGDPKKEIQDLDTWTQKYPESDWKWDRLYMYMQAYGKMNPPQPDKVLQYGQQLMSQDLNTVFSGASAPLNKLDVLYKVATSVSSLPNPTGDQIEMGKKAAHELQTEAKAYFTPEHKPAGTPDAAWAKAKNDLEAAADHTLLYLDVLPANQAMAKNPPDCAAAEPAYTKALQDRPQSAYISFQLGKAMVCLQKTQPEMASAAIYEFQRAAVIDPTLGDPNNKPEQLIKYADDLYTRVHGSTEGLAELKATAKQNPLPPAGFKIRTAGELAEEKNAQFEKDNPKLAMWMKVKNALTAPDGEQYFTSQLKDAGVPQLRGVVIDGRPGCRSKEIMVYVPTQANQGAQPPEIAIKLDAPLAGKPEPGTEILWEGVPTAFTKQPFLLTMDAEKAKVQVKTTPCAAAAPVHKKSGTTKKK